MPTKLNERVNVTDYLLGLDDLQQPKVIDMSIIRPNQWNSAVLMIARLLLMRKGQLEDHPDLGIDIRGRYRFSYETDLTVLEQELESQVEQYLPEFAPIEVRTQFQTQGNEGKIRFIVVIDQVAYELFYNLDSATIEGMEAIG